MSANVPRLLLLPAGEATDLYFAVLGGAGVIQVLDESDSDVSTSGLYQALSYQAVCQAVDGSFHPLRATTILQFLT